MSTEGTTPSERFLARLVRSSFLSLWSHPNLYTDEGRSRGKGAGKELADLVVVFGDHVVIFSDKHCAFPKHRDIETSWRRWYSAAVDKSSRQLVGAMRWIERFPNRIFTDSHCTQPIPIPLPTPDRAKVHLVAVTRGSYDACREHFGGGSTGSLLVVTSLRGKDSHILPFYVGHALTTGPFIHVLDEMTVEVLLRELDTASDFITYLEHRERFLSTEGKTVVAHGEEDLLVSYAVRIDKHGFHSFPDLPDSAEVFVMKEGAWNEYCGDPRYKSKKDADLQSYAWDRLIELMIATGESTDASSFEPALRTMAAENRLSRRILAEQMERAFGRVVRPTERVVITAVTPGPSCVVYLFVSLPAPFGCDTHADYKELRRSHLFACCQTAKLRFPLATKFVGIAREPFSDLNGTYDIMMVEDPSQTVSPEFESVVEDMNQSLGVTDTTVDRIHVARLDEYPEPFRGKKISPAKRLEARQRLRDQLKVRLRKRSRPGKA